MRTSPIPWIALLLLSLGCREPGSDEASEPAPYRALPFLDRTEVGRSLFRPRPDSDRPLPEGLRLVEVEAPDGVRLVGRLHSAGPEAPMLLWFPGNGERAEDYDGLAPHLARLGLGLLVFDHRGYGRSGSEPRASSLRGDGDTLCRALPGLWPAQGLAPSRVILVGRSLGSVPAIEAAARAGDRVDGLVLLCGFADTLGLLARLGYEGPLAGRSEQSDGFRNLDRLHAVRAPVLVVHGDADRVVPIADGRALAAAASTRLVTLEGAGHNDWFSVGHETFLAALRQLVER